MIKLPRAIVLTPAVGIVRVRELPARAGRPNLDTCFVVLAQPFVLPEPRLVGLAWMFRAGPQVGVAFAARISLS